MNKRYVICGPPGSGKSHWINERRKPGDIVFDIDDLAVFMAHVPRYTFAPDFKVFASLRSALVTHLRTHSLERDVYIVVMSKADAELIARLINAHLVTLTTPADECKRRLAADPARQPRIGYMLNAVDRWYSTHG